MTASIVPIEMKRGDLKRLNPVTIETKEGLLLDLTGLEVRWCLYRDRAVNPFLTKSSKDPNPENGVLITNIEKATVRITVRSEDTKNLEQGHYYHSILVVDSNQQEVTVASGSIIIVNKV